MYATTVCPRRPTSMERLIVRTDMFMLLGPFTLYSVGLNLLALTIVNIAVPLMLILGVITAAKAYTKWQGCFKSYLTQWHLLMSSAVCVAMLMLLGDWFLQRGWNLIGIGNHLAWGGVHYCVSRLVVCLHERIRNDG